MEEKIDKKRLASESGAFLEGAIMIASTNGRQFNSYTGLTCGSVWVRDGIYIYLFENAWNHHVEDFWGYMSKEQAYIWCRKAHYQNILHVEHEFKGIDFSKCLYCGKEITPVIEYHSDPHGEDLGNAEVFYCDCMRGMGHVPFVEAYYK